MSLGCGSGVGKEAIHVSGCHPTPSGSEFRFSSATHFRTQLRLDSSSAPDRDEEIWILLTRHLRSHRVQEEYIALTADSAFEAGVATGNDVLSTKVRPALLSQAFPPLIIRVKGRVHKRAPRSRE